jgi:HEAT repeat protein
MPKPPASIRLVPLYPDSDEMTEFAEGKGWEETEKSSDEVIQWQADDALVSWVTDPDTDVQFIVIEGKGRETVAGQIEKAIKMLRKPAFKSRIENAAGGVDRFEGLISVAAAAGEKPDPDVVKLITPYLTDDNPNIRTGALLAVGITGWKDFIEPVEAMRENADEDTRKAADRALKALRDAN